MPQAHKQRKEQLLACWNLIGRSTVSCVLVLLTQFCVSLVPCYFSESSLLIQLPLSGLVVLLVVGFGRWCRRLVGVSASAPALVFFNIIFIWGVYIFIIRQAISHLMDIVFNGEVAMLLIGVCSILSSNPGLVNYGSTYSDKLCETKAYAIEALDEEQDTSTSGTCHKYLNRSIPMLERVRHCKSCKAYVKGFDHHCPAFGNCIAALCRAE